MIYIIFSLIIIICSFVEYIGRTKSVKDICYFVSASLIFCLLAFRSENVGGDTVTYVDEFYNYGFREREIGYVLFCEIIRLFGSGPFIYIFCTSCISIIPFFLLVQRHSIVRSFSLLYLFIFSVLIIDLETNIRQNIGTGFLLTSILLFENEDLSKVKKIVFGTLFLIWGSLCHTSLYFICPLLLIIYALKFNKTHSLVLILVCFIIGGLTNEYATAFFQWFTFRIDGVEGLERLVQYSNDGGLGDFTNASFSISYILSALWSLVVVYSCNKDEINNIYIKSLIVFAMLHCIGGSSDLMYRLFYTIQLLSIIYIPGRLLKDKLSLSFILLYSIIILQAFWRTCLTPSMQNQDACMFPYTFIF